METHAHHLHHAPGKKFWHYFYEFLMLFLAVFCGFLAENKREHLVEARREKQYMKSFAEDLDADIVYMEVSLTNFNETIKKADSLIVLLDKADKKESANDIYYFFRTVTRHFAFGVNDRTIIQLRNAGDMRLISNKSVSDTIVRYYHDVDSIQYLDDRLIEGLDKFYPFLDKLLDGIDYGKLTDTANNIVLRVNEPLKLRTTDDETINSAILHVQRHINVIIAIKLAVKRLKERANVTRQFILKEYHLE